MIDSQSPLRDYLWQDGLKLFGLMFLFAMVGWLLDHLFAGLFLGLFAFCCIQLRALYFLYYWVRFKPDDPPPDLSGIWSAIAYNIYRANLKEKRAQANLQSVIGRARTSVSALEDAIVLIDGQDSIEWFNDASQRLLGLKPTDVGLNVKNLFRAPDFLAYYQRAHHAAFQQEQDPLDIASWVNAKRFLRIKITQFGENDKILLAQDNTKLHQLEVMRKDFVANVSHELRTPLTVLTGYLENFAALPLSPAMEKAVKAMQTQSDRMNLLIQDLLMLSYLESGKFKVQNTPIDMSQLLHALKEDADKMTKTGQSVVVDCQSTARLCGSLNELKSAFSNLVTNAIKYTAENGQVMIRWSTDEHGGYFSVKDTGQGIDAKHIPRLTERFYRVDSDRNSTTGGTGLGLSIVKHVLLQHDARLDIASIPHQGSTFCCVFPKQRIQPKNGS